MLISALALLQWNVNVTSASVTVYGDITVDEFNTNYDPGKNCGLKSGEPVNIAENGCGTFFGTFSAVRHVSVRLAA